ncbi:MAG TPA: hypothetical protein VNZ26_02575 [Vicinamibacterales bacterium]|nr:hypothetical protein [Vicinamibacterales bacterium]
MLLRLSTLAVAAWLVAPRAFAAELGPESGPFSVEVHAFAGQGFIVTTGSNYLDPDTKHGSFQLSDVGVNFTKNLVDKLRVGIQLFAQYFGPTGNYNARADWFYLDYRFKDWLGFRAGRVKIPFGLYNEYNDVDSARIPVLLPQSVYPAQNRNYLLAQTGGEFYGYVRLGSAGALDCRAYGGTIFLDTTGLGPSAYQVLSLTVPYLVGGRVLWETPVEGLRVGGSVQGLRLDTQLLAQMKPVNVEIPAILWVGSVEYSAHDLLLAAEYSRWHAKANSSDPTLFPALPFVASERAYAMVGYRANKWLQPSMYYAMLFPNVDKREGRANWQHDIAATLRFDINANWLVKLEGHFMMGTAGLTSGLNDNTPLSTLDRYWGVFLAKTTAYF